MSSLSLGSHHSNGGRILSREISPISEGSDNETSSSSLSSGNHYASNSGVPVVTSDALEVALHATIEAPRVATNVPSIQPIIVEGVSSEATSRVS